jgi:hypothetical protein
MTIHSANSAANVDRLRIATPCPISWEQMTGNSQVRFCDHCQLNVYNISELSRIEAKSLIASTEGKLCARLFRRADGSVLTKDCPVGLRAVRMQLSKTAAAVFATILGIAGAVFGQQSSARGQGASCTPYTRITIKSSDWDQVAARLAGLVLDPNGAALSGAQIFIADRESSDTKSAVANDEGRFQLDALPEGSYSIKIMANGFAPYIAPLLVERNRIINLEVVLDPGSMIGEFVIQETPTHFDTAPGTTIITAEMIRKLPIQK